jgi:RNA polymerase sigma factor (sigma-70 family)
MDDDTSSLTQGLARCDERAWREFHDRYFDFIHRLAVSRGTAASEAPELVQRVYLRVLRHAKTIRSADEFAAWLACLTRCETVDSARGEKRRAWLGERFQQWLEQRTPEPRHPLAEPLADAIDTLAADDRNMLVRHYFDGWSHRRIADHWRTSAKAVESRLARLRKRLRHHLCP